MADSVKTRRLELPCPVSAFLDREPHDLLLWLPSSRWLCPLCGIGGQLEGFLKLDTEIPVAASRMISMAESPYLPDELSPASSNGPSPSGHPFRTTDRSSSPQIPCPVSVLIDLEPHGCSPPSPEGLWLCRECELFGDLQGFLRLTTEVAGRLLHLATRCRARFLGEEPSRV